MKEISTLETQEIILRRRVQRLEVTKGLSRKERIDLVNRVN